MDLGLVSGVKFRDYSNFPEGKWLPYGPEAGEPYPLLDATTSTPSLGGSGSWQRGRFMVHGGMVYAYGYLGWGSGGTAGSGEYLVLLPPIGPPSLFPSNSASYGSTAAQTVGFGALTQDAIGVSNMQNLGVAYANTASGAAIPAGRAAFLCPHRYFVRGSNAGTFNVFGQVTVSHGLGLAPDVVQVTPTGYGSQGNDNAMLAVTTKGASTFTVTAITFGRKSLTDGQTNSNTSISSASALFTNADVQQPISGTNIPASTFITAVADTQHATISQAATGTGTGIQFTIGHTGGNVVQPFDWMALAPIAGSGNGGLFVTSAWPWTWGSSGNTIEWRLVYPINGAP